MKLIKGITAFGILILIAYTCGTKVTEESNYNLSFELLSMEERGQVDSVIMAEALLSGDEQIRKSAVKTCGIVGDNRFVPDLIELCSDREISIRYTAIFALGEIKDTSAVSTLAALLHDEDEMTAEKTVEALGKIGDKNSAKYIRPLLKNLNANIAAESAYALWRLADSSSIVNIKSNLSRDDKAGVAACYTLFRLVPDSCAAEFYDLIVKTTLTTQSLENREDLQKVATRGLGLSGDSIKVLNILDNYYDKLQPTSKIELFRSLSRLKIGHEQLESILPDITDNGLKREALFALSSIESKSSFKIVKKYFDDPSLQVRLATISAIPNVNKKSPTGTLKPFSKDKSWQVRAEVASALGEVKSRAAEKALKLMLEDKDNRVKASVIDGLRNYRISKNIDIIKAALFGSKDKVVKSIAADVLGSSENKKAMRLLIDFASKQDSTSDIDIVRSVIEALGNFVDSTENGVKAIESIQRFLTHPNRIIRTEAFVAIDGYTSENLQKGVYDINFTIDEFDYIQDLLENDIVATISTANGEIKVMLKPENAPRTVANFVKLAEKGFYDGLVFHRVVENFVIQGGCPRGDGWGDPGYMIREEINTIKFKRGTIGMATSGRDTGGSQFFICLTDQPHLDGRYTTFGDVIGSQDTIDNIELGDSIISITIERGTLNESGAL